MNIAEIFNRRKKLTKDLFYTILASCVGNAVLQLIAYPLIAKQFGIDTVGDILFFMSIIYIVPQAFGHSILNARLLMRKDHETTNGDYSMLLAVSGLCSFVVCAAIGFISTKNILFSAFYGIFSVLYMLKTYGGIEYRLALDFKGFFLYYLISAIGYLAGLSLYFAGGSWLLIFVIGEGASLFYVIAKGNIFKKAQKQLPPGMVGKTTAAFIWTALVRDCVMQFDRIVIMQLMNAASVTQYHAISVIAKTMQLFVSPLCNLMMTYMTQKGWRLTGKIYSRIALGCIGFGVIAYLLCIAVTPVFIRIFYPTVFDAVIQYNLLANLGLIIGFIASLFNVTLSSQGELKTFSAIQTIWGISYIVVAYLATSTYGLWGLVLATVAVNAVRLALSMLMSYLKVRQSFGTISE